MDRFPQDDDAREDKVCELIDARTHAIKADIRAGRVSTTERVLDRMDDVDCDHDEALDILCRAVLGGTAAVGVDYMAKVESAIFFEAEELAEVEVADMERNREREVAEVSISERAVRWLFDRGVFA